MGLAFCSVKAYNFVRDSFEKKLPHIRTIQEWQKIYDGKPGFNRWAIPAIKNKIDEADKSGNKLKFALNIDGMYINSIIECDNNGKHYGYVDYGDNVVKKEIAKEAIVFLITTINGRWKIPVAYYFVSKVSTEQMASMVEDVLYFLESNKIDVISLTFDGLKTNISMVEYLGASVNPNSLKPYFYSLHGSNIFIMLDAAHMIKLIRSQWASKKIIYDENNSPIKWYYIWKLNDIQEKEGLYLFV